MSDNINNPALDTLQAKLDKTNNNLFRGFSRTSSGQTLIFTATGIRRLLYLKKHFENAIKKLTK